MLKASDNKDGGVVAENRFVLLEIASKLTWSSLFDTHKIQKQIMYGN